MSKSVAIVSSGASTSILIPPTPTLTFAVVSLHPLSGKSSLCQRLTNENFDQYRSFALKTKSTEHRQTINWFYWGSIKHRRSDDKREAFCHFIEHSSVAIDQHEHYENYLKRISTLTFRSEEKFLHSADYPQIRTFPKDKIQLDGFLCLHDLSSNNEQFSDLFFLLHGLMKTRRPVILITTKNDSIEHQAELAAQFEQIIRRSHPNIPILHSSANENVNIRSILDVLLFVTDESTRKSSSANLFPSKSFSISYDEALRNEQSLRTATLSQFRTLLNRNLTDYRQTSWSKFHQTWQHHNVLQTSLDLCGKEQIERIFLEHLDELKQNERKKLIDERLIPIIELLVTDPKTILSRNWDFVRLQMQEHPEYSSTVIPTSKWSDEQKEKRLCIPADLLETSEARHCFQTFLSLRQLEQTRRTHCRAFFDLLNRFADAGLVQYGHSFEKDSVYFLGRESFEALNSSDRHRVFAFHQSYLYRLLCLKFVELLFESFEIFIETFRKMNLATTENERKLTTISIDEIFEKEIIQQIKHEPRYQMLNHRATDRHRLIMCHCHFLYDCIYYPPIRNLTRLIKQRKRSFKRQKSSSQSLYGVNMNIEENFCPYTRKIPLTNSDEKKKKKFEIGCPMEDSCADVRIMNEFFGKKSEKRNILICGNENETKRVVDIFSKHPSLTNDYQINVLTMKTVKNAQIDGCLIVSIEGRQMIEERNFTNEIPIVDLSNRIVEKSSENLFDEIRSSCEEILFNNDKTLKRRSFDLRILLVFMCGGETNDVERFFSQLSSNFLLKVTNEHGETSFIVQTCLNRTHRQIELIPVSFHSLFSLKFNEFDGFILFYDRDRKAAINTMTTLEKQISKYFENDSKREKNRAPIYLLSVIKDFSYSTFQSYPQTNFCVQCHSGTLRNFVKYHFVPFLNQCTLEKAAQRLINDELTTNFSLTRPMRSSTSDLLTSTFERSVKIFSHSNDHSPRNPSFSLTPTNTSEQIFCSRSYPYLSLSTIVPTTPVDPSVTNLGLLTENSSTTPTNFKKSTSMKFAKLVEHPINHLTFNADRNSYQSTSNEMNNGFASLTTTNRRINENASDNMKFHLYKHRTAAHVKVPLATPEIIEFNESIARPFTIEQHDDQSIVLTNQNTSETSSSSPAIHQQRDSSIDSSSDEIEENSKDTSLVLQNLNAPTNNKISDRKTKRIRTNLISTKKTASDDEEKRRPTEQYQKKKRRPSFKRRKKLLYDQTLTDSGIDSRMDGKDSTKTSITTEPSSSSNIVISNEEDSSIGDLTKDSKNTSIEELEERPTANWIRRQLQHFAQGRRDKNRSPATVTSICSPPIPSFKATMTSTPPNSHANVSPLSSVENSHQHHPPLRLTLSRCAQSSQTGVPLFIEKCIEYIEEFGLGVEGLYRVSGYKNQVDLVINRLIEDPTYDLRKLQVPASAVATALKDMMRKLDEPLLSLDFFDECQNMTIEQLRSEDFLPLRKALSRTTDLKFRTIKFIFKHLHFVSQHAASTHMDSSNLAVLWWPNLFQPQFRDLRTAEQTCQKAKPLIQAIIDNYSLIFDRTFLK